MRTSTKLLLAGVGALVAGAALAADRAHVLDVVLPDGTIAHIHYVGDVAPHVVVAPAATNAGSAMGDPFAMMDHMALAMDQQMGAILQQAAALPRSAPPADAVPADASFKQQLPPGTVSYSYTSYSSNGGTGCSQSVQVTALDRNQPPKVERRSSGDCTAMNSRTARPAVQQAAPAVPVVTPVSLKPSKAPTAKDPVI